MCLFVSIGGDQQTLLSIWRRLFDGIIQRGAIGYENLIISLCADPCSRESDFQISAAESSAFIHPEA